MAKTVKSSALNINIMPQAVHTHFNKNDLLSENEIYLVEDDSILLTNGGTVISENADYAEIGEWYDGNINNEDRIGYFVSVDIDNCGITMMKSRSDSDVRGVTMAHPGFAANATRDKYDEDGNLLRQYDYVGFVGFIPVIDNGTCTVHSKCMPGDDGTAVPSINNMGYQVIERIDATHVLILVEPQADMMVRIRDDITGIENDINNVNTKLNDKQNTLIWLTEEDIDAMFNGSYGTDIPINTSITGHAVVGRAVVGVGKVQ